MTRRPLSQQAAARQAAPALTDELASAEARGADELREQLLRPLDERRRIVRQGDQQIEVVEVSALLQLLDEYEQIRGSQG